MLKTFNDKHFWRIYAFERLIKRLFEAYRSTSCKAAHSDKQVKLDGKFQTIFTSKFYIFLRNEEYSRQIISSKINLFHVLRSLWTLRSYFLLEMNTYLKHILTGSCQGWKESTNQERAKYHACCHVGTSACQSKYSQQIREKNSSVRFFIVRWLVSEFHSGGKMNNRRNDARCNNTRHKYVLLSRKVFKIYLYYTL